RWTRAPVRAAASCRLAGTASRPSAEPWVRAFTTAGDSSRPRSMVAGAGAGSRARVATASTNSTTSQTPSAIEAAIPRVAASVMSIDAQLARQHARRAPPVQRRQHVAHHDSGTQGAGDDALQAVVLDDLDD